VTRRRTLRTVDSLVEAGLVDKNAAEALTKVAARYAISITPTVVEALTGSPDDPIGRQFVPTLDELIIDPDELTDPIGDERHTPVAGITHRYRDRVLLKPVHVCPVYCRFCFRREVVGPGQGVLTDKDLRAALAYIGEHTEIWEVILTGGDPLIMSPARIRRIVGELDRIPHVAVVRIHSRVPVLAPERITDELIEALTVPTPVWLVVHCNHHRELGPAAAAALRRLSQAGIPLLSQSVLLRGVNDTAEELERLFRSLVALKVKPYYLHHPDLAPGTAHLRTSIAHGQRLMRSLRGPVSGLCQPTYVLDIPGGHGKVPIAAPHLTRDGDGYLVTDPAGVVHRYAPKTALVGDDEEDG
jgi:lysine-2,3-aminomutase-related protein